MSQVPNTVAIGAMLLLCLSGAAAPQDWTIAAPPPGTVALPALVARDLPTISGGQVKVCMQAGTRPQTYTLISRGCWNDADTCTAFVGVPSHDDIRLMEYDASNPPVVVTTDDICTVPGRSTNGVLGAAPRHR